MPPTARAANWLAGQFDVRQDRDVVVLPYYRADGQFIGLAKRYPKEWDPFPDGPIEAWRKRSYGPRMLVFIGEHRLGSERWVLLCEGESDTLAVAWWLRDTPVAVLGLQSSIQKPSKRLLDLLRGRRVVLLPDADPAGDGVVKNWAAALDDVRVARLPRGLDACDAGRETVLRALRKAKTPACHRGLRVPAKSRGRSAQ